MHNIRSLRGCREMSFNRRARGVLLSPVWISIGSLSLSSQIHRNLFIKRCPKELYYETPPSLGTKILKTGPLNDAIVGIPRQIEVPSLFSVDDRPSVVQSCRMPINLNFQTGSGTYKQNSGRGSKFTVRTNGWNLLHIWRLSTQMPQHRKQGDSRSTATRLV